MSDNAPGAGNQQERPDIAQWVVGFVDGEGCFVSVPIFRNPTCRLGWQAQPMSRWCRERRACEVLTPLEAVFRMRTSRSQRTDTTIIGRPMHRYHGAGPSVNWKSGSSRSSKNTHCFTAKAVDFEKFAEGRYE